MLSSEHCGFFFFFYRKDFQCFKEVDSVHDASQQSPQVQDLLDRSIGLKSCSADVTRQILDDFDIHVSFKKIIIINVEF